MWNDITVCNKFWLFWVIFGWLWVAVDVFFLGGGRGGGVWVVEGGCKRLWMVAYFSVSLFRFKYLNKCIKEVSETYLDSLQKSAEKELRKILTDRTFTFTNFHAHTLSYHYIPIEK